MVLWDQWTIGFPCETSIEGALQQFQTVQKDHECPLRVKQCAGGQNETNAKVDWVPTGHGAIWCRSETEQEYYQRRMETTRQVECSVRINEFKIVHEMVKQMGNGSQPHKIKNCIDSKCVQLESHVLQQSLEWSRERGAQCADTTITTTVRVFCM